MFIMKFCIFYAVFVNKIKFGMIFAVRLLNQDTVNKNHV